MTDQPSSPDARAADRESAVFLIDESLVFLRSAALRAVAAAGVGDHLADGARTVPELAALTGTDAGYLYRVLRVVAARGVVEEDAQGRFRLTRRGAALCTDHPLSMRAAVLTLTDPTMWRPAGEMDQCVRDGTSAFARIFGTTFFEHFAQDQKTAEIFHAGMAALSEAEDQDIADSYAFPEPAQVVDVGGGRGGLLKAVLDRRPGLHGVLYDQQHVLAEHSLDTPRTAGRWETAQGDFFTSVPEGGDIYLLKRILHDWDDEQCVTLLRNCRRAMAPHARVLVVDAVVPQGNVPHQAKLMDLLMMAALTGRERTEPDFSALFDASGLQLNRIIPTPAVLSIVEATAA